MNRTERRRRTYVCLNVLLAASFLFAVVGKPNNPIAYLMLLAVVVLHAIRRYKLRNFSKGAKLLQKEKFEQATAAFTQFCKDVDRNPGLNVWYTFNWSIYTDSAKAVAWANIAICEMGMGKVDKSNDAIERSLRADPLYSDAYAIKAAIQLINDNPDLGHQLLDRALELGHPKQKIDGVALLSKKQIPLEQIGKQTIHEISTYLEPEVSQLIDQIDPLDVETLFSLNHNHKDSEYVLIMLDDDKTSMAFVNSILIDILNHDSEQATELMLKVHKLGQAITASGDKDTLDKVQKHIETQARKLDYPLVTRVQRTANMESGVK